MENRFITCLNCIDGRTQIPLLGWLKQETKIAYVDLITEPGINGLLSKNDAYQIKSVLKRIDISIKMHDSKKIFIAGHSDCKGYVANEKEHKKAITDLSKYLKKKYPFMEITGLWISLLKESTPIEKVMIL